MKEMGIRQRRRPDPHSRSRQRINFLLTNTNKERQNTRASVCNLYRRTTSMSRFRLDIRSLSSAVLISALCLPSFAQVQVERPRRRNPGAQADDKASGLLLSRKK